MNIVNIKYPKNANPNCLVSAVAANFSPNTPFWINQVNPIAYQKNAYAPNAVAPNVLSCLKSLIHANNCAVAPRNIAHGNTNATPEVIPNFCDEATKVIIASPNNPNADGSAVTILSFACFP